MSVSRKTVELFYDVISPYTWFAFEDPGEVMFIKGSLSAQRFLTAVDMADKSLTEEVSRQLWMRAWSRVLSRYKNRWNIDLKLKPFFLGGIMNESDNKPPGFVPNKSLYMAKELKLLAKYYDVPLKMPKDPGEVMFIKGSLSAQRFLTAVDMADKSLTEEVSRQLWMRAWSRDEDITKTESFIQAGEKAGLSEEQIKSAVGKIKDQAVKDRLKQYTDEALSHGAFGSPTIIAHVNNKPVMLFGSDRFPILAQVLGEKWDGPLPESQRSKL